MLIYHFFVIYYQQTLLLGIYKQSPFPFAIYFILISVFFCGFISFICVL